MKTYKQLLESYYAVVDKNGIIQFKGSKSIAKKKLKDHPDGFIGNTVSKKVGDKWKTEDKEIPKGYHRMPDGTVMKNSDHSKKKTEQDIEEVSAAMRALRRRNKKTAYAKKTIAKYADAARRGIPAHKVK